MSRASASLRRRTALSSLRMHHRLDLVIEAIIQALKQMIMKGTSLPLSLEVAVLADRSCSGAATCFFPKDVLQAWCCAGSC